MIVLADQSEGDVVFVTVSDGLVSVTATVSVFPPLSLVPVLRAGEVLFAVEDTPLAVASTFFGVGSQSMNDGNVTSETGLTAEISLPNVDGIQILESSPTEVTFTGPPLALDDVLRQLVLVFADEFAGEDVISITVVDEFGSASVTANIRVAPVNDPPVLVVLQTTLTLLEDEIFTLTPAGVVVDDVDSPMLTVTFTSLEAFGRVEPADRDSVPAAVAVSGDANRVTLDGPLGDIQTVLLALAYVHPRNEFGIDQILVTVSDEFGVGSSATIDVMIIAVNGDLEPSFGVSTVAVVEETLARIPPDWLTFASPETLGVADLAVTVGSEAGSVQVASGVSLVDVDIMDVGDGVINIVGSLADVNLALGQLSFQPYPDVFGSFPLSVNATDDLDRVVVGSVVVEIEPVDDSAVIVVVEAIVETTEETPVSLSGVVTISDIDRLADEDVVLNFTAANGVLSISDYGSWDTVVEVDADVSWYSISVPYSDVDAVLEALMYEPVLDYVTPASEVNAAEGARFDVSVSNNVGDPTVGNAFVQVTGVNDGPVIELESSVVGGRFEAGAVNVVLVDALVASIDDVDAGDGDLLFSIVATADGGIPIVSVPAIVGITTVESDVNSVVLAGPISLLRLIPAVASVARPGVQFSGDVAVLVSLNDLGNSGIGNVISTEQEVVVNFEAFEVDCAGAALGSLVTDVCGVCGGRAETFGPNITVDDCSAGPQIVSLELVDTSGTVGFADGDRIVVTFDRSTNFAPSTLLSKEGVDEVVQFFNEPQMQMEAELQTRQIPDGAALVSLGTLYNGAWLSGSQLTITMLDVSGAGPLPEPNVTRAAIIGDVFDMTEPSMNSRSISPLAAGDFGVASALISGGAGDDEGAAPDDECATIGSLCLSTFIAIVTGSVLLLSSAVLILSRSKGKADATGGIG